MLTTAVISLLIIGIVAANLPWLTARFFFFFAPPGGQECVGLRRLEWLVLMGFYIVGSLGVERKLMGANYQQGWEFYTVLVCLFVVFALPGFIYRYDLRSHLDRRERRSK